MDIEIAFVLLLVATLLVVGILSGGAKRLWSVWRQKLVITSNIVRQIRRWKFRDYYVFVVLLGTPVYLVISMVRIGGEMESWALGIAMALVFVVFFVMIYSAPVESPNPNDDKEDAPKPEPIYGADLADPEIRVKLGLPPLKPLPDRHETAEMQPSAVTRSRRDMRTNIRRR